ncbi:hypothetical protein [Pseudomonas sp. BRM28]|uniref:hypothetical protein n=1 Tax=Pseudomonas sp. BRM28 TaxID=2045201 RepID=UPI001304B9BA|nr:hypothetical protein [Pseudomonas sp. BRM28]
MPNDNFSAHTHYGHFKGTAAADDFDLHSISQFLEKKGLVQPGEFLAGVKVFCGGS